ncbi:MAG: 2-hydroxyacid dehydrogenase [Cytophagaceae bacterium]
MNFKILIVDDMHSSILPMLEELGLEADYRPDIGRADILACIERYDGLIVRSKTKVDSELLNKASALKLIARAGAGLDQISVEEAIERKIHLINASEGNRDALGEHALGILLTLMNKIQIADRQVRQGVWDREGNRGYEIGGKTVGIIGYGHMGRAFAKRLQGFNCKVIAYDKYLTDFSDDIVHEVDMDTIFQESDVLSLHIPLTEETRKMVNKAYFLNFRKNIWFVNTARGEIVETGDLVELLTSGKIFGAALDVLENEKLQELSVEQKQIYKNLMSHDNVVFTPHVGGWSYESYEKINQVLIKKIRIFLNEGLKR